MKNNTNKFNNKAKDYVKFRPTYPNEFINYLVKDLKIKDKVIADIGFGTGKLTELIINDCKTIYAVEPNKDMRVAAEKILNKHKTFHSVNGSAENTTLKDNSIDLIIVAQAFHWFDAKKARIEFKRILKPKGIVVLVWNLTLRNTKFLRAQRDILHQYSNLKEKKTNNLKKKHLRMDI